MIVYCSVDCGAENKKRCPAAHGIDPEHAPDPDYYFQDDYEEQLDIVVLSEFCYTANKTQLLEMVEYNDFEF